MAAESPTGSAFLRHITTRDDIGEVVSSPKSDANISRLDEERTATPSDVNVDENGVSEDQPDAEGEEVKRRVTEIKKRAEQNFRQQLHEMLSFDDVRAGRKPFADHALFEAFIGSVIALNTVMIGIAVDNDTGAPGMGLEYFFTTVWILEAVLKMYAYRLSGYFCSFSNLFDFLLCAAAVLDVFILPFVVDPDSVNLKEFTVVRLLRVARVLRLMRLVKMFQDLWLLCVGLVESISALGWTLVLMSIVIYGFAIFFTSSVRAECDSAVFSEMFPECLLFYGNLPASMYTLFEVMTLDFTGLRPLIIASPWMMIPMLVFIMVAGFGLMNIIMGVIVEKVLEAANANEAKLEKQKELRQKLELDMLGDIFEEADADKSGCVTLDEFLDICDRKDVQDLFSHLDLRVNRRRMAIRLFEVLDAEQQGELDIHTFLERCLSLKQEGKHLTEDMTLLLVDVRHINRRVSRIETGLNHLHEKVDRRFNEISDSLMDLRNAVARSEHIEQAII